VNQSVHVALVKGKPKSSDEPLVRVHIQDTLGDVLSVQASFLGWPIRDAIRRISEEENGIVVILREQESSRDLMDAINGLTKENKQVKSGKFSEESLRTYGIGAQILRDLGIKKMRVLSAPKQMYAISGFDLKITEYVEK
jgi:3,4-dihydroxy 2-butanone 4-phosphate synthase/GTP cyclohydrolase II